MNAGLFDNANALAKLELPGGELYFSSSIPLPESAAVLLNRLLDETPWRQDSINIWGKAQLQPRLSAWFGDPDAIYTYSGLRMTPLPWTTLLLEIKAQIERLTQHTFNSVLLNCYRDQLDRMGYHSDDEPELGPQPVIASLSLGAERTFVLKSKFDRNQKPCKIKLGSGSLLVMKGDTQKNWLHAIHKETAACGPRVNLTFRRVFK